VQVHGAAQLDQPCNLLLVVFASKNLLAQAADFIFHSTGHGALRLERLALLAYISRSICDLQRFV
jgi:hypothetical protein